MYSTAYNLWTFTWFVHFELPLRLKGTEKIHTERLSKFPSNIYSILFGYTVLSNCLCNYVNWNINITSWQTIFVEEAKQVYVSLWRKKHAKGKALRHFNSIQSWKCMHQPCGLDLCVNNLHNVKLKLSRCQQNPTAAPGFPIHFGVHILDWRDFIYFGVRILDWRDFFILESVYWTGGTYLFWSPFTGLEELYSFWSPYTELEGLYSFWSPYTGLEELYSCWSPYTGLEGLYSFWSPYILDWRDFIYFGVYILDWRDFIHFGVHILDWRDYIHFGVRILDWRDFIILESVYWTGGTLYILESIYLDWRDFIYFGVYILGLEGLCSFWSLYTGLEGLNSFWSLYTGLEGLFSFWSPYTWLEGLY